MALQSKVLRTLEEQVDPKHSAVLVIDAQRDFCSSSGAMARVLGFDLADIQRAVPQLNRFVRYARQHRVSVVWVREVFSPSRMLPNQRAIHGDGDDIILIREGSSGVDWYEELTPPLQGEPILTKWNYDAFANTDLALWFQARGVDTVIMGGFTTNVCVETSARHAYIKGFYVVVLEDCTGAPLREEHDGALLNIRKYFGRVEHSDTVMRCWAEPRSGRLGS